MFLGTRGEIERRTHAHRMHSSLLVEHAGARVMVDCGLDWLEELEALAPSAIVLTHAHLDHAGGLKAGAPCPVYATEETLRAIRRYGISAARPIEHRRPFDVLGLTFEAFPVVHSLRAPAVGYRIAARASFFYVPDVVAIPDLSAALTRVALYVGDGASLVRPIVRRRDGVAIGHAPIVAQLDWCAAEGVPKAIFTHCGSQILRGDPLALAEQVRELGRQRGIDAAIALDGMELTLSATGKP